MGESANITYTAYCDVAEEQLNGLYEAVEGDFSLLLAGEPMRTAMRP